MDKKRKFMFIFAPSDKINKKYEMINQPRRMIYITDYITNGSAFDLSEVVILYVFHCVS